MTSPHLYYWHGSWWVTRNGPSMWREGITLNDREYPSFEDACRAARAWSVAYYRVNHGGVLFRRRFWNWFDAEEFARELPGSCLVPFNTHGKMV